MKKLVVLTLLTVVTAAHAAAPAPKKGASVEGITEYALDNGLRVLLFPDASKPTMTVNLTVLVGSRMEGYGESGMAHLLEHMVYKGTPAHPKIMDELTQHGARFNGSTNDDRTNYFETFPASDENLKWALGLESDRLVHSNVLKKDLDTEFSVVRNEFERGENSPFNVLIQRMMASAYEWHNYGKSTIGSRSDIERVPIEALQAFYHRYYQPDNAVLVVAGKIDPQKTLALVNDTFGKLPRPKRVLAKTYTTEPVQDGEHQVIVRRTGDTGLVGAVYHGVAGSDADFVAEEALADILAHRPSGRLYKALVDKGLASSVSAFATDNAEPGVLMMFAEVPAGKPLEPVRDQLTAVVEGLGRAKISDEELQRFKTGALKEIELGLTDSGRIGVQLSEWAAQGDWRLIFLHRDAIKALTVDRVQKFAQSYFKPANRTLGLFIAEKSIDRSPLPSAPDVAAIVKDYKGQEQLAAGEAFQANIPNIEKRTERVTLPGGMKLALLPKKTRGEAVRIMLQLNNGAEADFKGTSVATPDLLSDMIGRGSKKYTYQQFRDELDKLKARWRAVSYIDEARPGEAAFMVTTVRASVPSVLSLLAEVLREPTFPKDEFETLRKENVTQLEESLQQPQALAMELLLSRSRPWPKDDPRHRPTVKEQLEAYKAAKVEDLIALYKKTWGASAAELVLVGDFDAAAVKAQVEKELASWKSPRPFKRIEVPYRAPELADELIRTPDKQMAMVGFAQPLPVRDDDADYPALHLANFVFGGNQKSRLWERLRQKEGWSYGTQSSLRASSLDRNATFFAMAICAPQNAVKAMGALVEELTTFLQKGVGADELKSAKIGLQAQWETSLADDNFVMSLLERSLYLDRKLDFYDKLNARMQAMTPTELAAALTKYVKLEQLVKVKAGDIKN
jgi:zinc protease